MRHGIDKRKLGRGTSHRMAMMANMATSMIEHGRIETTLNRARELRRMVEKLVTKAKVDSVHNRRIARQTLRNLDGVTNLFEKVAPRFKTRPGGYTRLLKKSTTRMGDSAEMAFVEFVDYVLPSTKSKDEKKKEKKEKQEKKALEKQATAAGKAPAGKKEASMKDAPKKASSTAAGGPKKSTTVRKISGS